MLPTVLRKIVLRFQPGTGQFLVTRPARARWRDSIGGNVSAHHRVSCPVHAGARHAGDLVDHHGLYGTGCRRRRRAPDTGHRSLNPNVTPPGLRPGAREGEPQARRCRSRVSVPSSAVERGPGRSARPVGRRHAQASRAGQRPGRTEPPRGRPDNRGAAAWQWAGSAPSPRRRAPRWRSRRPPRAVRNRMSPSPSGTGHRSLNPNVTPPGLRPGAREGEPGNGKQKRDPRGHVKRDPPVSVNSSVHDLLPWRLFRGCSDLADGLTLAVHIVTCALRSHSRARRVRLSADAPGGVRNRPP